MKIIAIPLPLDACLREAASAKAGGKVCLPAGRQEWGWRPLITPPPSSSPARGEEILLFSE